MRGKIAIPLPRTPRRAGSFGINQIQTIQTATFGRFSFFPSVFDHAILSTRHTHPATPIAQSESFRPS